MKSAVLLLAAFTILSGCARGPVWECPTGEERARFRADAGECKAYARDMTREEAKQVKVPGGAPHAGVVQAFITYGIFQEYFGQCMEARGWRKKGE